jgi:hypothetical protein
MTRMLIVATFLFVATTLPLPAQTPNGPVQGAVQGTVKGTATARPKKSLNVPSHFAPTLCARSMVKILPLTPRHGLAPAPSARFRARPERLNKRSPL